MHSNGGPMASAARPARGFDGFTSASSSLGMLPEMAFHRRHVRMRQPGEWRPSPPTQRELAQPFRPAPAHDKGVLVLIIAGQRPGSSLLHNSSLSEVCAAQDIRCAVYTDTSEDFDVPSSMEVIAPHAYLEDRALPPPKTSRQDCCRRGRNRPKVGSSFFCDAHRVATLASQYRFLPALAHARRVHERDWAMGRLSWLVMVDDDAVVNTTVLLRVLDGLDPDVPAYYGDFGEWTYAIATSKLYKNASLSQDQLAWEPPYACGGAGTVFSRGAVRKLDFLRCASRYHVGCFQSDWMIGRCAAEAGVLPMVSTLSCGLCLMCKVNAHTQRRLALARLRSGDRPPCFALTTCDHHLPVPLRRELCLLLPRRTPIMHGWKKMCGSIARGPEFPSLVAKYVSATRPVTSALRALHVSRAHKQGLHSIGLTQLEDLMDLLPEDLEGLGMSAQQQARFMQLLWDGGPVRSSVDPTIQNATPLRQAVEMLRLQQFRRNLHDLGLHQAADLGKLTQQEFVGLNMSRLQIHRVAALLRQLGMELKVGRVSPLRLQATAHRKPLPDAREPLRAPLPDAQARPSVSFAGYREGCDCAWTRGPQCRGQHDDFTKCWAVCCPSRGPRFGNWRLSREQIRRHASSRRTAREMP